MLCCDSPTVACMILLSRFNRLLFKVCNTVLRIGIFDVQHCEKFEFGEI
jgi:hypothetical protein